MREIGDFLRAFSEANGDLSRLRVFVRRPDALRVEQRIGEEPRIAVRLRPDSLPITLTFVKTRWPCDAA